MGGKITREDWFRACGEAASIIAGEVPEHYRTRTFSGLIGDIKALSPRKAQSLMARKKGLGKQYARLYLDQGIDGGKGYQACAAEALGYILESRRAGLGGDVLDVGCAVGVTAGILELEGVTGFDLFTDLLLAARLVDAITGKTNRYLTADMTREWPFRQAFQSVVCGLVCHHLKGQTDLLTFFSSACRALEPGGSLVITLPSGSVAFVHQARILARAIEEFGFSLDTRLSGMVAS
ncbi:MAG: methyltransferase domain-containing protein, partial [Candidatus Latescibacterota bacterium]